MTSERAKIIFNSRDERFKKPVGAVRSGTYLEICILVDEELRPTSASMIVIFDKENSSAAYKMEPDMSETALDGYICFQSGFKIEDTGLYWYEFEIVTEQGVLHAGRDAWNNRAVLSDDRVMWQQTVYKRSYPVPEWICGGVFYQIFVDRFNHSGAFVTMENKIIREDWGGMPEYRPNEEGRIVNNDFFGGNLQGIIEKLPYLESLGVTCLVLSPVFEAYSNHKYDTSDYSKIDSMFGTEQDFRQLCREAGERGMRVICDGVFSHTGADSIYFDKYGNYGGKGAYGHPDSPYRSWYYFYDNEQYETWWGIDTLPRVNKSEQSYINFICGKNGIARRWLKAGASGWRLDVVDELPSSFVKELAAAVKAEKPDSLLIGEVWEDASSKSAYDERKNYFEGDKLDSVMNYPFRNALIGFVHSGNAELIARTVSEILEFYPEEVVCCLMNVVGTHDTERILTAIGGARMNPGTPREVFAETRMNEQEKLLAIRKMKMAVVVQMTLPGVPCIYYGDEAGTEGYSDPFNRSCYPWDHEDHDLLNWYRKVIKIRRNNSVYKYGKYREIASIGGFYAFERYGDGQRIITAANCGNSEERMIIAGEWQDLLSNRVFKGNVTVCPGEIFLLAFRNL